MKDNVKVTKKSSLKSVQFMNNENIKEDIIQLKKLSFSNANSKIPSQNISPAIPFKRNMNSKSLSFKLISNSKLDSEFQQLQNNDNINYSNNPNKDQEQYQNSFPIKEDDFVDEHFKLKTNFSFQNSPKTNNNNNNHKNSDDSNDSSFNIKQELGKIKLNDDNQ